MTSRRLKIIHHQSGLIDYIGEWRSTMNHVLKTQPPVDIPQVLFSLIDNTHDLSLMLSYLDVRLTILEETPPMVGQQIDYQAYSEARTFLKVCYLLVRILFDDVSGIIEYFYKKNESNVYRGVKKGFTHLLKKARKRELPRDLCKLLEHPTSWFDEMETRRDDLVHNYDSLLISFKQDGDGKVTLGHFSMKKRTSKECEDFRQYFGFILCEYQNLIDNILDHFDTKFMDWYRFKPSRASTISAEGYAGIMLWWAYKYGNYRKNGIVVVEDN